MVVHSGEAWENKKNMTEPSKKKQRKGSAVRRRGILMDRNRALSRPYEVIHWLRICHRYKFKANIRVGPGTNFHLIYHASYDISLDSAPKLTFLRIPDCDDDVKFNAELELFCQQDAQAALDDEPKCREDLMSYVAAVMNILAITKAGKVLIGTTNFVDFGMNW